MENFRHDVLFPELLPLPLRRNPIPSESRPAPADPIRGFPIRWSIPRLLWLPYLPAVVTYHYPIFRNMNRSPGIKVVELGFVVDPSAVTHWSNIESVIRITIDKVRVDATTCQHQPPPYPLSFGYTRTFKKRKQASEAAKKSLLAFHHMLAYCSYVVASSRTLHLSHSQHRHLYENPTEVATLFKKINDSSSSHVLLKLLWSSLGEIRQTRNFAGVVVTYDQPYDYESVRDMHRYGVPIYIRWSGYHRFQTYSSSPRGEILAQWRPSADSFTTLGQPQHPTHPQPSTPSTPQPPPPPEPSTSSTQRPPLPPPPVILDRHVGVDPWQYVESRKAKIAATPNKPQSWLDREVSARSFAQPGRYGSRVYQFTSVGVVEEGTGKETQVWERAVLTRAEALSLWNGVKSRNLW